MMQKDQIEQIKQQLIEQIQTTFPNDKKDSAIQQIESMDSEQLEEFLIQNNLIKEGEKGGEQQCVFCSIISNKIQSHKISENENAIAVLEINPISKGHVLIIPKPHVQEVSKETEEFARQVSLKLKEKLQAKKIEMQDSEVFGHKTINIIPIYDGNTLKNERKPAQKKDLENLQKELQIEIEPEEIEEEEEEPITDKNTRLPRRIP